MRKEDGGLKHFFSIFSKVDMSNCFFMMNVRADELLILEENLVQDIRNYSASSTLGLCMDI